MNFRLGQQNIFYTLILVLSLFCVQACSDSGGIGGSGTGSGVEVSGNVEKGPFAKNSAVTITLLNTELEAVEVLTTDDLGSYSAIIPQAGVIEINAAGKFWDEIIGGLSSHSVSIAAIYEIAGDVDDVQHKVNVNLLTHFSRARIKHLLAESDLSFREAKEQAEQELIEQFEPLFSSGDVEGFSDLSLYDNAADTENDSGGNAYLIALTSAVYQYLINQDELAGGSSFEAGSAVLEAITDDFSSDGEFDVSLLVDELEQVVEMLNPSEISSNLNDLLEEGTEASVADINLVLDSDGDGLVNNTDTDDDGDGVIDEEDTEPYVAKSYSVGGALTGLGESKNIHLQNNTTDDLSLSSNGQFSFSTQLEAGESFNVTVQTAPIAQICTITNGSGFIIDSDLTSIQISCADITYKVGGVVSGLSGGKSITLQNNTDEVLVDSSGAFSFSAEFDDLQTYNVSIKTQPVGQSCILANSSGDIAALSVANILVECDGLVRFVPQTSYGTGSNPVSIAISDIDSTDGDDIIVTNKNSNNVSVYLNQGDGSYASKVDYATGLGSAPESIEVADVDGKDGPDLLVGSFIPSVSVHLNKGDGTFSAYALYETNAFTAAITSGNFDGHNGIDIAAIRNNADDASILFNNGAGTFANSPTFATGDGPEAVVSADVDGDESTDLVVANANANTVSVLINNGDGSFAAKVDYATGSSPGAIFSADIDGKDGPDILVANYDSANVSVLLNNGDGTFGGQTSYPVGSNPISVSSVDVDGLNGLDLLVANNGSNTVSVLLNSSDGAYTQESYSVGNSPSAITYSNVDGLIGTDLIVTNEADNTVSVLLNTTDRVPDIFALSDQSGVERSSVVESDIVTVTGLNAASPIAILNGEYRINGGEYTSAASYVNNNDTVQVRVNTSDKYASTIQVYISVGPLVDTYSVTTTFLSP